MIDMRLIVADPGHFHAALVQKEMYPNLSPRVYVYAPVGPDLADYLTRIARFNTRREQPTRWQLEVHAGPDFLERMCHERPGTVAIFSGRNRGKAQRILSAVEAGINVLADKPLIVDPKELPVLEAALTAAADRGLIVYDMSSGGRQAIIATLMRLLRNDPKVFGDPVPGTPSDPGVTVASLHHIMKQVAGVPNLRPPWFFDTTQQGESLADVGTHLIDRAQAIDYRISNTRSAVLTLPLRLGGTGKRKQVTIPTMRPIAAAARNWSCARGLRSATSRSSTSCRPPMLPLPSSAGLRCYKRRIRASVSSSFAGNGG